MLFSVFFRSVVLLAANPGYGEGLRLDEYIRASEEGCFPSVVDNRALYRRSS